jgi:hypothetical protein
VREEQRFNEKEEVQIKCGREGSQIDTIADGKKSNADESGNGLPSRP